MQENNKFRTGRHAVFQLYVHLVFTPKYRRKIFTDLILKRLEEVFKEQCIILEAELIKFNGESDHVHLLINFPAKISISQLVRVLKGISSRMLRKKNQQKMSSVANSRWKKDR